MIFSLIGLFSISSAADRVVTTITDFAWLGERLVKNTPILVESLLDGSEDPHHVDASPSYVQKAANAKVLAYVGMDLEVGWLPRVVARSGNAAIQAGAPGDCDLSKGIAKKEVRTGRVDRSMGDVHPEGNPHYWLGYRESAVAAAVLSKCMAAQWPAYKRAFVENLLVLQKELIQEERAVGAELRAALGAKPLILEYHREYSYFLAAFGYESRATLESKPGVSPSAGRIAEVAEVAKAENVLFLLSSPYYPGGVHAKFTESSGVPVLSMGTQWQRQKYASPLAQRRELVKQMIDTKKRRP